MIFKKNTTVASVMGAFNKALADLQKVVEHHSKEVEKCDKELTEIAMRKNLSKLEIMHANKVAAKLSDLV